MQEKMDSHGCTIVKHEMSKFIRSSREELDFLAQNLHSSGN